MNGSLLAAAAGLLSVLLWLASRRRPAPLLATTSTAAVAALNRAQLSLVQQQPELPQSVVGADLLPLPPRGDARQRRVFLAQLQAQLAGDQPQRLAAIRQARRWGDPAALPLLRRGLRDVDLQVCAEAACAVARFRGRTPSVASASGATASPAQLPLPRNVARTR
jgi:HEAT repeat protein